MSASGHRRRYDGRSSRTSGGFGIVPIVLLLVLGVVMWKLHGGSVAGLRNLQYSIFH
jgi:hypothetical protein